MSAPDQNFVARPDNAVYETDSPVQYTVADGIATVTMSRTEFNNAQNSQMTYALDTAFRRAVDDDAVKVIVLRGDGKHFSAGHDIGTPGRDINKPFDRVHLWWDHTNKPGGEYLYAREQEVYLNMCRRWRDLPKRHPSQSPRMEVDALAVEQLAVSIVEPGFAGLPRRDNPCIARERGRDRRQPKQQHRDDWQKEQHHPP